MSFFSRISKEATTSFQDAYANLVLGDDAGKAVRIVLVLKPVERRGGKIDLGMTFIEINGRAYVRTLSPGSEAAKAGVMPRDAIQFAAVFKEEWNDIQNDDVTNVDEVAKNYALHSESLGIRISYEELRQVLAEGMDPTHTPFLSPPPVSNKWRRPPIPSTINVCAADGSDYVRPLSPFRGSRPHPVVFVFRRTRQRPTSGLLAFRLDDECDFASSLIRRLAPTADMDTPTPDTWEEMVHDGTDWLLGTGSMLPPKRATPDTTKMAKPEESGIPLDDYEKERAMKLARLRSRMAAEAMQSDRAEDVEAATIRAMIQKAVGLAFVRASKVVLGVSLHAGSGIVVARLSDGTWSAPSSVGTWGLGFGIQFGLEVAEYIFILQTQESLDNFRKGGSFTIGGNVGAAVAGMGREAYGAASVGSTCNNDRSMRQPKEDEYNDDDDSGLKSRQSHLGVAPIVAYAKSQGLYIGVSLEGSRIFTRDDINARAYKFASGREVTANDILSGKVTTPPEAEDLYASLHSVEFTHEMSCLPRPPEILRDDSLNSWYYDRSTLTGSNAPNTKYREKFTFLQDVSPEESEECAAFETQFKKFMYGGVSVQRLVSDSDSHSQKTTKERRTLWLMLPEVGALRLGFVSKLSDGEGKTVSNKSSTRRAALDNTDSSVGEPDTGTVASEEVTLDSALLDKRGSNGNIRAGNVQLSNKHSLALTDVTMLSQDTDEPIRFSAEDQTEHLRVISIKDISGTTLLFVANNFREAELLYCGLKLLLERETARLGVRGGLPIESLGGKPSGSSMSPAAARGFRETVPVRPNQRSRSLEKTKDASSSVGSDKESIVSDLVARTRDTKLPHDRKQPRTPVPEERHKWGNVPGRNYMRGQAAQSGPEKFEKNSADPHHGMPKYSHGQLLVREICSNIHLPIALPLCRVLMLGADSPVLTKWEKERGDRNFSRTTWTFPPVTPRELEQHDSEHQLIASGSMMGAHRTMTFDRPRNGVMVHLSETKIVDADDSEKLAFSVSERMPRRGFSIKVKVVIRTGKANSCEAMVVGEVRPVGKNMSNQAAVHKAFQLVVNEIATRYGSEGGGLIACFMKVVNSLPSTDPALSGGSRSSEKVAKPFSRTSPSTSTRNENGIGKSSSKGAESGLVSFEDIMNSRTAIPEPRELSRTPTPSVLIRDDDPSLLRKKSERQYDANEFAEMPVDERSDYERSRKPTTIEVKPLPKIRLSLMPSPREEDEEDLSSSQQRAKLKKKKPSKRKSGQSSARRSNGSIFR